MASLFGGNASLSHLDKIRTPQKRALVEITAETNGNNADINRIDFDLKILNLHHQLQSQLAS